MESRTATLSEVVAGALRQALEDGVYLCGERLVELTIAREMNVSQNTARDALRILEQEGWVVKRARYGVYVRTFTSDEITEIYALRAALETLALRWALAAARPDDHAALRHLITQAHTYVNLGGAHGAAHGARAALFDFHVALGEIARKPATAALLRGLHNQSRLLENARAARLPYTAGQWAALMRAYDMLLHHIERHDALAAEKSLRSLLLDAGESLSKLLHV